jgi:hypothetical protein
MRQNLTTFAGTGNRVRIIIKHDIVQELLDGTVMYTILREIRTRYIMWLTNCLIRQKVTDKIR